MTFQHQLQFRLDESQQASGRGCVLDWSQVHRFVLLFAGLNTGSTFRHGVVGVLRRALDSSTVAGHLDCRSRGCGRRRRRPRPFACSSPVVAGAFCSWIACTLFVPSLALALGLWSGTSRFFEAVYTAWWYVGPAHHTPGLELLGTSGPIDSLSIDDGGVGRGCIPGTTGQARVRLRRVAARTGFPPSFGPDIPAPNPNGKNRFQQVTGRENRREGRVTLAQACSFRDVPFSPCHAPSKSSARRNASRVVF